MVEGLLGVLDGVPEQHLVDTAGDRDVHQHGLSFPEVNEQVRSLVGCAVLVGTEDELTV